MATQPPPAAMRATKAISYHYGMSTAQPLPWESLARLIDEETGLPELIRAAREVISAAVAPTEEGTAAQLAEAIPALQNALDRVEGRS